MKKSKIGIFALGAILGGISGCILRTLYYQHRAKHTDMILEQVKKEFAKKGNVTGSWIEMKPVVYATGDKNFKVNYGGINRCEKGHIVQYEFIADAMSGMLIDIYPVAGQPALKDDDLL
ncbi:MAG: hypothetical protein H9901_03700 [Candidatus Paralactobacillus gallistercoris]|uniref:PepSY domain-containing protein n=1 Tax=Candidatus Paralactobacillus gallistercoris TaxID=2838724 RepID=A0A948TJJ7_9LACO|nr:hypothetical protein [Candidatus Paralactobacillus gallistercoris]